MPELLEVAALDAFYGQAQVLFDVSLSVGRGEVVADLGATCLLRRDDLLEVAHRLGFELKEIEGDDVVASAGGRAAGQRQRRQRHGGRHLRRTGPPGRHGPGRSSPR